MSNHRITLLVLGFASVGCRPSSAPVPASTNSYLHWLGSDTLAAEQFTRAGDRIEGTLVVHLPRTVVTRYVVTLNPTTGRASQLEYNTRLPDGGVVQQGNQQPLQSVSITLGADSAVRRDQRDTVIVTRAAARDAFPYINYSMVFFQLAVSALRAANADTAAYVMYTGGRQTTPVGVALRPPDMYSVSVGGFPYSVVVGNRGVVEIVDGARTTQHFVAKRQGSLDLAALTAAWAQRESSAPRVAALSPRDTVNATVGSAQLWVDYGRPLARGRKSSAPTACWATASGAPARTARHSSARTCRSPLPARRYPRERTRSDRRDPGTLPADLQQTGRSVGHGVNRDQDLTRAPLQSRPARAVGGSLHHRDRRDGRERRRAEAALGHDGARGSIHRGRRRHSLSDATSQLFLPRTHHPRAGGRHGLRVLADLQRGRPVDRLQVSRAWGSWSPSS